MTNPIALILGSSLDNALASPFLLALNEAPRRERIEEDLFLAYPSSGILICLGADDRVSSVFLYSSHNDCGYNAYIGELPNGLTYNDGQKTVHSKLGRPARSGGGVEIHPLGKGRPWDRFDNSQYALHVEFTGDKKAIAMITIMRPDVAP